LCFERSVARGITDSRHRSFFVTPAQWARAAMKEQHMWSSDDFPGASHVPWQLLIRARLQDEVDAALASTIVRAVADVGSQAQVVEVARAAHAGLASRPVGERASAQQRIAAIDAAAEFDDYCGNGYRWPIPHHLQEFGDPAVLGVLAAAEQLVKAGSENLQKAMGPALQV
jgi:hypothetical protein